MNRDPVVKAIGDYVRQRRRANRLTQRDLGHLAGAGTRLVSELERGKPSLRMDGVNAILAVFGKSLGIIEAPSRDPQPHHLRDSAREARSS